MQVEIALASSLRWYTKNLLCAKLYVAGNRIQVKDKGGRYSAHQATAFPMRRLRSCIYPPARR